jgi:hypothetical protein
LRELFQRGRIVKQVLGFDFAGVRIAPTHSLLMRMKGNSNVYWHHGFSCQRTNCCCHPQFYLKGARNRLYNITLQRVFPPVRYTLKREL